VLGTAGVNECGDVRRIKLEFGPHANCCTPALGAEVFSSGKEEYYCYHPCKSRACPSCGWCATLAWQFELNATLPDIPYRGIVFTMPRSLWTIFKNNRHLLHDLPAIGAEVIQQWVKLKYGTKVLIVVVQH
jgi:Transposase zinc-binding domain